MKRHILANILVTAVLGLFGIISADAQTGLNGKYIFEAGKEENLARFILTFERADAVYYSYFYQGAGTIGGKWQIENGVIKAVLSRGDENWTIKLKRNGDDLEIAETLPEKGLAEIPDFKNILPAGTIFKKMKDTPSGKELTPAETGKKVLKLIESVKTAADLSAVNLEKQVGMKVSFNEKNTKEFGVGGKITGAPDWFYNFSSATSTTDGKEKITSLNFSFDYQLHEPLHPDMTTVCKAFNFDSFSKYLQADGFSAPEPRIGVHNRQEGWIFNRNKISVLVAVTGGWQPNVDNCVKTVIISAN